MRRSRLAAALPRLLVLGLSISTTAVSAARLAMFVTSQAGSGKLSTWAGSGGQNGLTGGDNVCQALAAGAGLAHPDAYRAWLSTNATDAYCHVHRLSGKKSSNCGQATLPASAGPWVRTDGSDFAPEISAMLNPEIEIFYPPRYDEAGTVRHVKAWTGTDENGEFSGSGACNGWSSAAGSQEGAIGYADNGSSAWTAFGADDCSASHHLYCFETISGDALAPRTTSARFAFVTSIRRSGDLSSWPEAGGASGFAAANTICRSLAFQAGIPLADKFKAWLSNDSTDAVDRIDFDGPWMRLDRVLVASDLADLTDGYIRGTINVTEQGIYLPQVFVFTGTGADGHAELGNCSGWSSATGTGGAGETIQSDEPWTFAGELGCAGSGALYCLQDFDLVFWDSFESHNFGSWSDHAP